MIDIRNRFLTDEEAARVYAQHPEVKADPAIYCPTCQTSKTYFWRGEEHECDCQYQLQLLKWYVHSGVGAHYQRLAFDDYDGDPVAKAWVDKYLDTHERMIHKGFGFLFWGDFGTGKTLLLMLLVKELIKYGYSCFCTTFAGMIELFTAGWNSAQEKKYFHERMKGSEILFIDDVGRALKTKNNLAESTFDDILRSRIQAGRPTFLTTNMSPPELMEGYGGAVFSLLQEVSIAHQFTGSDQRPSVVLKKLAELEAGETRPIS